MNPRTSLDSVLFKGATTLVQRLTRFGKAERETLFVLRFYVHTFLGGSSGET